MGLHIWRYILGPNPVRRNTYGFDTILNSFSFSTSLDLRIYKGYIWGPNPIRRNTDNFDAIELTRIPIHEFVTPFLNKRKKKRQSEKEQNVNKRKKN